MSENSYSGSEASSARDSPVLSSQSSQMTSLEILSPSAVQAPDFHTIETKFDVLTGIVSHLHKGLSDQAEENQNFKNQFDTYSEYTNRKIENLSSQFNTRLSDMSKDFDTKLENQSVEINTKLQNNFVNLHGEMGKITTAMEKQADYILEKLFPLKASFNDKPSSNSNSDTTHLVSSGPSVHEINNQNKSNNQNLQNPENHTSGHIPSAFVPIENTKNPPSSDMFIQPVPVTSPQIDKPINVVPNPSISFNNHNSGNVGYTKPNSYDGKSNWSDYKVHFEIVAQLNGWSSEIKALKLISCMQNEALAAIGDINTNCPPSYSELINTLTRRFAPENQTELYKTQIDTRIRKRGESLPELAQDIKRLVRLAYPKAHQEVLDSLAYRSFREALNDYDLAWALTQSNIDAVDDALNLALKYEAFHSSHRKPNLRKLAEVSEVNTNYNAPKTHFKGGNSGKGACYYCGEPGHFKRDCEKRMTDNNQFIQQMKSGQYNNNQGLNRQNNQSRSEVSTTNSSNQGNC
ncbi:unnamed protein product [Mytilus edulis]|uniref:CCHC-type domain-containing protein n=1 Tax=Mytilus edulis TaxID=6550 RepID=A0A8S3PSY4_MYTED|nr:unnamed protein product [Mytilus edulis]